MPIVPIRETPSSLYVMHMKPKKHHNVLKLQEFNRLVKLNALVSFKFLGTSTFGAK